MNLPVRFPSETESILDDVSKFRSLLPLERVLVIRSLLADGMFLVSISPKAAWSEQDSEDETALARKNLQDFIRRHGY